MDIKSPNFDFLAKLDLALMHQAALAVRYCIEDPNSALMKLRLFGELLAKNIAARFGVYIDNQLQQNEILKELKYRDVLDQKLADMFHSIRIAGNAAVHEGKGSVRDALQNLRFAHQLAVYFYRVFKNTKFKSGPFQVPPNPANVTEALQSEMEDARNQSLELQGQIKDAENITKSEAQKRKKAEKKAAKAWEEFNAALELAQLCQHLWVQLLWIVLTKNEPKPFNNCIHQTARSAAALTLKKTREKKLIYIGQTMSVSNTIFQNI